MQNPLSIEKNQYLFLFLHFALRAKGAGETPTCMATI
jgi:hypothetical protein